MFNPSQTSSRPSKSKHKKKRRTEKSLDMKVKSKKTLSFSSASTIVQDNETIALQTDNDSSQTDLLERSTEEIVKEAVEDFFDSAWMVCSERYCEAAAPDLLAWDLRDTWLRIVEAEWQDPDIAGNTQIKPNTVLIADEPPLPLALDGWSRGGLEQVPHRRRESVMDPFLRDPRLGQAIVQGQDGTSVDSSSNGSSANSLNAKPSEIVDDQQQEQRMTKMYAESSTDVSSATVDVPSGEIWNFELDKESSDAQEIKDPTSESIETPDEDTIDLESLRDVSSVEVDRGSIVLHNVDHYLKASPKGKVHVHAILRAQKMPSKSSTENEFYMPKSQDDVKRHSSANANESLPFSTSEKIGSETFHLKSQNSTASAKADNWLVERWKQELRRNTKENRKEEPEVQPLFIQTLHPETSKMRSSSPDTEKYQDMYPVLSHVDRDFLKRQLMNLRHRFTKQAMKNIAGVIKARKLNEGGLRQSNKIQDCSWPSMESMKTDESGSKNINFASNTQSCAMTDVRHVIGKRKLTKGNVVPGLIHKPIGHQSFKKPELRAAGKYSLRINTNYMEFRQKRSVKTRTESCESIDWIQKKVCGDDKVGCSAERECRF